MTRNGSFFVPFFQSFLLRQAKARSFKQWFLGRKLNQDKNILMIMTPKVLEENDFLRTQDLALATAISLFYPLAAIDRESNPRKAQFVFKRDAELDELITSYWRRELRVEPQAYFDAMRAIKGRLYDAD
jgi:hypothetical protein